MSKVHLVHITDTHYATVAENIQIATTRSMLDLGWSLGSIARGCLLKRHGVARAELRTLWPALLAQLTVLTRYLASQGSLAVVHSGDITQAGQSDSLQVAVSELSGATRDAGDLHVLPGNHDVWPRDFPAFAPARTSLQARFTRSVPGLPKQFPHHVNVGNVVDLVMLDSAVPDTMLNTSALGRVDAELDGNVFVDQLSSVPRKQVQLRGAVMHHPPADLSSKGQSWWRAVQQSLPIGVGMVLLDAAQFRSRLQGCDVAFVLCGHEHAPPATPEDALVHDGHLLILQAGCPSLVHGAGNNDDPQFSMYELDFYTGRPKLHWYICHLEPLRWESFGSFEWDATTRTWSTLRPGPVPSLLPGSGLPKAPPITP